MRKSTNSTFLLLIFLMVGINFVNGGFSNPIDWLMNKMLALPAIIIGLSFHEFGHAAAAYKLGDPTPKHQGRVTVNPMAHVDPFGFLCLMLAGFGWGVPVQINPNNFKKPRRDELIVASAGVVINLIIAIASAGILRLFYEFATEFIAFSYMGGVVQDILINMIVINLVLMVFNLIPIPPLDGFGIITQVFNLKYTELYYKLYQNGFLILMLLIVFNVTDKILTPLVSFFYSGIIGIFF